MSDDTSNSLNGVGGSENNNNSNNNNNNKSFQIQPTLIHISEILQHSIELKLCSSIETHNVFWDTLLYNLELNGDAISMIISLLLTKYMLLLNNEKTQYSLLQALFTKLTNASVEEFNDLLNGTNSNNVFNNNNNNININNNSNNDDDVSNEQPNAPSSEVNTSQEVQNPNNNNGQSSTPKISRLSSKISQADIDTFNLALSETNQTTTVVYSSNSPQISSPTLSSTTTATVMPTPTSIDSNNNFEYNDVNYNNYIHNATATTATATIFNNTSNMTTEEIKESENIRLSILSTIGYLALFHRFNSQFPTLKVILHKLGEIQLEKSRPEYSFHNEIMRILQPGYQDNNDFLFFLIDQCSDQNSGSNYNNYNNNNNIIKMNSWYNSCLRKILREESTTKSKAVFEHLLLFLKHPLLSEKRVLFLLQMLKHYLLVIPVLSSTTIQSALTIVKNYYLWPKPYGCFAKEILEILSLELKSPGSYFRNILAREFPSIMLPPNSISSTNLTNSIFTNKNRPTIHFLVDKYNSEALLIQELFEINYNTYTPSITQLQSNNIENIYKRILGINNSQLGIEFLEPVDVSHIHFKILEVMNKTMYLEESESKSIRIKELIAIREEIIKLGSTTTTTLPHLPKNIELPNLNYQFLSLLTLSVRHKRPDQYGTPFQIPINRKSTTSLIQLLSNYQDQEFHNQVKFAIIGNDTCVQHVLGSFLFLKYQQPELFDTLDIMFYIIPTGTTNCKITDLISSFDPWYNTQVQQCLKSLFNIIPSFIPIAKVSNTERQSFIESISQIKDLRSSMSVGALKDEDIPNLNIESLSLSGNINDIENKNPILSEATAKEDSKIHKENPIETPSHTIQTEVEYLFREASFRLEIPVLKCEGWVGTATEEGGIGSSSSNNYYTIPFLMKAEMNKSTFLAGYSDLIASDPSQATKLLSKYSPMNVCVKLLQCNQLGIPLQWITIDSKTFYDIEINNVMPKSKSNPTISTTSSPSTASSNLLKKSNIQFKPKMQLNLIEAEQKKKKIKSSEDVFKFTVNTIEIESVDKKKSFDILLDGQLHGPFNKVKISFCVSDISNVSSGANKRNTTTTTNNSINFNDLQDNDYINFPILSFLPLV